MLPTAPCPDGAEREEPALRPALEAAGLVRRYGSTVALRGVGLVVRRGEAVALLGPNGAGKTTLLRVLATLARPSAGSIVVDGVDALRHASVARRLVGLVAHQTFLYGELTARENLRFYGRLYGLHDLDACVARALDVMEIAQRADAPIRTLSRGMQQRVAVARATLHEPLVLLLDEPETGLDDASQERLARLIARWAHGGGAVLVASHRLEWVSGLADHAVVLREGRVAATLGPRQNGSLDLARAYHEAISGQGVAAMVASP
ncbi:MAG TPA: heme ABC exporter ATP-binding protein CcmA [Chloroflexota bacterium]|nr:heme ABC exporter ATP-binding protein CcmA [Chloroflexota bacterium]